MGTNSAVVRVIDQHEIERTDDLTPIKCLDCGGSWRRTVESSDGRGGIRHYTEFCNYCIRGGMNEEQQSLWRKEKNMKKMGIDSVLQDYLLESKSYCSPHTFNEASPSQTGVRRKK